MECDIFTFLVIIILVVCIYKSCLTLRLRPTLITGGKITDAVNPEEVKQILDDNAAINNLAKLNYKFSEHRDKIMELTKTVVSKK